MKMDIFRIMSILPGQLNVRIDGVNARVHVSEVLDDDQVTHVSFSQKLILYVYSRRCYWAA
jgi:hypothetical protein